MINYDFEINQMNQILDEFDSAIDWFNSKADEVQQITLQNILEESHYWNTENDENVIGIHELPVDEHYSELSALYNSYEISLNNITTNETITELFLRCLKYHSYYDRGLSDDEIENTYKGI